MATPTKPEAEQGTEVREFRVRYEWLSPLGLFPKWVTEVRVVTPEEISDGFEEEWRRNIRIETRTVTTTPWAPAPEEKP